jgi:hypothetical protein
MEAILLVLNMSFSDQDLVVMRGQGHVVEIDTGKGQGHQVGVDIQGQGAETEGGEGMMGI